jgi:U3 small nucleolar RNA-associated protein 4
MPASIPLHHCKFIDYTPASITAIAFPPLPLRSASSPSSASASTVNGQTASSERDKAEMGWMAVGKGNGDVELFRWVQRGEGSQGWVYFKVSCCFYSINRSRMAVSPVEDDECMLNSPRW